MFPCELQLMEVLSVCDPDEVEHVIHITLRVFRQGNSSIRLEEKVLRICWTTRLHDFVPAREDPPKRSYH